MVNNYLKKIYNIAKNNNKKIAFFEYDDRIYLAISKILTKKIAKIYLIGNEKKIKSSLRKHKINQKKVVILDPLTHPKRDSYNFMFFAMMKDKGFTLEKCKRLLNEEKYFALFMLYLKEVDGVIGGLNETTGDFLRAIFKIIGTNGYVSGAHLLIGDKIYLISDTAVIPKPNAEQLAQIAISSAKTYEILTKKKAKVAMLSFSTKGSSKDISLETIREAVKTAKKKERGLIIDGEFQLDAAIDKKVAKIKAPKSIIKGDANVLIVPDLNCGNILYKSLQRLGKQKIVGPLLQNTKLIVNDLSRGAEVDEIVDMVVLTTLQIIAHKKNKR